MHSKKGDDKQPSIFKKNRILLVDDEEFCLVSMEQMIKKVGINVVQYLDSCITGLEAVNQIKHSFIDNIQYSIIFTDFSMPEMDGLEATQNIR